jgi:uncharacterized protein with WD repeat
LTIWNSLSGKEVGAYEFRKTSKEGPKSIKFTKNESFFARLASKNSIEVFEEGNFSAHKYKIVAGPHLSGNKKNEGQ